MTTVIYARVSGDQGNSALHQQELDCRGLAAREGLGEPTVIVDDDGSTAVFADASMSGWNRLRRMLDAGHVDHLVTWHPDRLWRGPADLERIVDAINNGVQLRGTQVHTVQHGSIDLGTAEGRLAARMGAAIASYTAEREARDDG